MGVEEGLMRDAGCGGRTRDAGAGRGTRGGMALTRRRKEVGGEGASACLRPVQVERALGLAPSCPYWRGNLLYDPQFSHSSGF